MKHVPRLDLRPYRGQWVALDPKTHAVIAHHRTVEGAEQAAKKRGFRTPLLFPVPRSDAFFVGAR